MKNYQLNVQFRNQISDTDKAILGDYWDVSLALKPREIAKKHGIS